MHRKKNRHSNGKSRGREAGFSRLHSSSALTWQCYALYLVWFTRVSLQFTFGHRVGLSQVEKGQPVPHGRLLGLNNWPLVAAEKKIINQL